MSSGYDAIFNYANIPHKPLTQMTVGEVDELQDRMRKEIGHSPVGKYQITQKTLRELIDLMRIDRSQTFDADLQEFLARQLLERRGLSQYMRGKINSDRFQRVRSQEWASIADPDTNQVSKHQTLGTSNEQIRPLLAGLKSR